MDNLGQILVTILGFFASLTLLLVLLDYLESTLHAPPKPLRERVQELWQSITRSRR